MNARSFFAGAYGGDARNLQPRDRLECKICWTVYDPGLGDPERHIPAGTPFAGLPAHWTCPTCDAPKTNFLLIKEEGS